MLLVVCAPAASGAPFVANLENLGSQFTPINLEPPSKSLGTNGGAGPDTAVGQGTDTVAGQKSFNKGVFKGSSADRNDNSGVLGVGYRNGSYASGLYDGLQLFYRFDRQVSGSGGTVRDYSGNGFDGVYRSVEPGVEGVFGTESAFENGNGSYLLADVPDGGIGVADSQSVTVSMWAKGDGQPVKDTSFAGHDAQGNQRQIWAHTPWTNGYVYWDTTEDFKKSRLNTGEQPSAISSYNEWNHYVFIHNSNTGRKEIWTNGVLAASGGSGLTESFEEITELYLFSSDGSGSRSYSGSIDEFMVWNRSLSQSEVQNLYFEEGDKGFEANYSRTLSFDTSRDWTQLDLGAELPASTDLTLNVSSLGASGNTKDFQSLSPTGSESLNLDLRNGTSIRISLNGTSTIPTETWKVQEVSVLSKGVQGGGRFEVFG